MSTMRLLRFANRLCAVAILLSSPALLGQAVAPPGFAVATVKLSAAERSSSSGISTGHGLLDARNVTLKRCVMGAYSVGPHQVVGGPPWINTERFDIVGKSEQPVDEDAVLSVMLQGLLKERFGFIMHRETRTLPAYVLEVLPGGPHLTRAEAGEANSNTSSSNTSVTMEAQFATLDAVAIQLSRQLDLPVVNGTGLSGTYNVKLRWTPESARLTGEKMTDDVSVFTAVQEQLGLRLRATRAPIDVLVIDHVDMPSEN